jgi:hypothetical protein
MNTATAARIGAGVTAAYVRELTRHPAPTAGDARRDEPSYRRERGRPSALDASGRRHGRPDAIGLPAEIAGSSLRISSDRPAARTATAADRARASKSRSEHKCGQPTATRRQ